MNVIKQRQSSMKHLLIMSVLMAFTLSANADVTLNGIFTDHMVLQRDMPAAVYGVAEPGEKVSVSFADQLKTATADNDGKWSIKLDAMKASARPAAMSIEGENKLTLDDILIGDVWVCSGQSNMGFAMGAYGSPYVPEHFELPLVRQFHVDSDPSMSLKTSVKGNTRADSRILLFLFSPILFTNILTCRIKSVIKTLFSFSVPDLKNLG